MKSRVNATIRLGLEPATFSTLAHLYDHSAKSHLSSFCFLYFRLQQAYKPCKDSPVCEGAKNMMKVTWPVFMLLGRKPLEEERIDKSLLKEKERKKEA
jgi:hypothetical protein